MAVKRLRPIENNAQKKNERNRRLSESDWTQMNDSPLSKADQDAWKKYRQALRDMKFEGEWTWPMSPAQEKSAKDAEKAAKERAAAEEKAAKDAEKAAKKAAKEAEKAAKDAEKANAEEAKVQKIKDAINKLDPNKDEHWAFFGKKSQRPDTDAIEEFAGERFSAKEIKAVWESMKS